MKHYIIPLCQPNDSKYLAQQFGVLCRAFSPGCELDLPGDDTVSAKFEINGFIFSADMYPSIPLGGISDDPGKMLILLTFGDCFSNGYELLWSGYDIEQFIDVMKQVIRDPEGTKKQYIRKNKKSVYAAQSRHEANRKKLMENCYPNKETRHATAGMD